MGELGSGKEKASEGKPESGNANFLEYAKPTRCPVCKTEYDDGREYCDPCFSPTEVVEDARKSDKGSTPDERGSDSIAESAGSPSALLEGGAFVQRADGVSSRASSECAPSLSGVDHRQCPYCGYEGVSGVACPQCGSPMLNGEPCLTVRESKLCLPDGTAVALQCGHAISIGRESPVSEIARALRGRDTVSRKHCAVTLSSDRLSVVVEDCGSTNGTWVDGGTRRIGYGERVTVGLPAEIRLGKSVVVSFE